MYVETASFLGQNIPTQQTPIRDTPAHISDVNFFNSTLENPRQAARAEAPVGRSILSEHSAQLDSLTDRVTKGLRNMSLGKNPAKLAQLPSMISDSHLQTAMTVKILNKSTQALEKLTNLQ